MVEGKVRSAPCVGHGGNTLSACAGAWRRCGKVQAVALLLGIVGGSAVFETSPIRVDSISVHKSWSGEVEVEQGHRYPAVSMTVPLHSCYHPTRADEGFVALVKICFSLIVRAQRCEAQGVAH